MKKLIFLLAMLPLCVFTSCSDDDKPKFDYPMETLYGKWEGTEVYTNGKWVDITKYPYTELGFSITFNSDGKYYGSGAFGNGSGTYKAEGKTITTYIDGEEFARYTVKTLDGNNAELTMYMGGDSMDIRVKKK